MNGTLQAQPPTSRGRWRSRRTREPRGVRPYVATAVVVAVAVLLLALLLPPALFPFASTAAAADPAWQPQTSGTTQNLRSVFFTDASNGWVVGEAGAILHTANGGTDWQAQTSGTTQTLFGVHFADASHGWVVGNAGTILYTADGGGHWSPQTSGTTKMLKAVTFVDAGNGWASGGGGTVLHTENGGQSWAPQPNQAYTPTSIITLDAIVFPDATNGWVGGQAHLLRTTNGGASWAMIPWSFYPPGDPGGTIIVSGLATGDGESGWAVGVKYDLTANKYEGFVTHTDDGWNSGERQLWRYGASLQAVTALDGQRAWVVGSGGTILVTTNGGTSWTTQPSGTTAALESIVFPDAEHGWAVGANGTILKFGEDVTPPPAHQCFLDVGPSHPYFAAVEGLCNEKVIDGYPVAGGKEFRPQNAILRAQFAKMICGVVGLQVTEAAWQDASAPFSDLGADAPDDLYPHDYVAVAAARGITYGKTATTFAPWVDISRAQVVSMVVRAANSLMSGRLVDPPTDFTGTLTAFDSPDHKGNLRIAEYNGLLAGLQGFGATWDPWAKANRGEAAQIMWNLLNGDTPPPPPPAGLLYSDDFQDPSSGWPVSQTSQATRAYEAGRYAFTLVAPQLMALSYVKRVYDDVTVEVDATPAQNQPEAGYGIICRLGQAEDFYEFTVQSSGVASLWRVNGDDWSNLSGDIASPAINKGAATNHLKLTCRGSTITFWVNGTQLGMVTDSAFSSGQVGLYAETFDAGNVKVFFDNLKIWAAE